jgi:hypothetical protein
MRPGNADTRIMSKESRQSCDDLRQLLESATGTKWRIRQYDPDGYLLAISEYDNDSVKLIAANPAEAERTWLVQLNHYRWGRAAG